MAQGGLSARRSAGTETGVDVLLRWARIRRRSSAQDIADFRGGQPLRVVGFTKSIGGAVMTSIGRGNGTYDLIVPKKDAELMRYVFGGSEAEKRDEAGRG
ncbi:hypothetical protein [Streptomyces sp. NPDC093018]|uniref:hypothetical protein n=1 Tax=Streptomyces sp. NPDC093018 TaxID=3155067 RepID=UPI003422C776